MKCKKCGFISFDFNQYCPKCNRALSEEQRSLNLPAFRPEPPMLLRRLLGDAYDDGDVDLIPDRHTVMEEPAAGGAGLDDSLSGLAEDEVLLEDEEEFDVVSPPPSLKSKSGSGPKDKEPVLDLDDISAGVDEEVAAPGRRDEEDDLDLVLEGDDLILDESMVESYGGTRTPDKRDKPAKKEGDREEDVSFSLDDLSFEDLDIEDGGSPDSEDSQDKAPDTDNAPAAEFDVFKDSGTMEAFYLDSNAEGLTKEIDMKKFRRDGIKDKKP